MSPEMLSDESLVVATKDLLREENRLGVEVLKHLREIDRRKIYLTRAYGSLFEYCVHELKLSESSAYRRIQALRLMNAVPQDEEKISSGVLNLTTAARVQTFLRLQKENPEKDQEIQPLALVEKVEGLSTRDVEKVLVEIRPEMARPEKIRRLDQDHFEMKISISKDLKEKLDLLMLRLSHRNPSLNYEQLFEQLVDLGISKLKKKPMPNSSPKTQRTATPALGDDQQRDSKAEDKLGHGMKNSNPSSPNLQMDPKRRTEASLSKRSRFISSPTRQKIWQRDQGKCVYWDSETKRECGSRYQLQVVHIHPYALGGSHEVDNLRLLCRAHNSQRAKLQGFGFHETISTRSRL